MPRLVFWLERPSGYRSPYALSMAYGAAVLAPAKYGQAMPPVYVQLGRGKLRRFRMLWLLKPFNKYIPGEWARKPR